MLRAERDERFDWRYLSVYLVLNLDCVIYIG